MAIKQMREVQRRVKHVLASEAAEVSWCDGDDCVRLMLPPEHIARMVGTSGAHEVILSPEASHDLATMLRRAARAKGYTKTSESSGQADLPPAPAPEPTSSPPPGGSEEGGANSGRAPAGDASLTSTGFAPEQGANEELAGPARTSETGRVPHSAPVSAAEGVPRYGDYEKRAVALKKEIADAKLRAEVRTAHAAVQAFGSDPSAPEELQLEVVRFFNMTHPEYR